MKRQWRSKDLIPAMDADSRVLINDMALPYTGVHWWVACVDLQMYTMHGALERNVDQWHTSHDCGVEKDTCHGKSLGNRLVSH